MNRRSLLQGLAGFGLPVAPQSQRKLEKLAQPEIEGECPVCQSKNVLNKFDAVTAKYLPVDGMDVSVDSSFSGYVIPASMVEVACEQCGVCYLTKNPAAIRSLDK